jgi:hypothetical protein
MKREARPASVKYWYTPMAVPWIHPSTLATMPAIPFIPVALAGLRRFTHYARRGTFSRPGLARSDTSSVPVEACMILE